MLPKNAISRAEFVRLLNAKEDGDSLSIKSMTSSSIPEYLLTQLFLNALTSPVDEMISPMAVSIGMRNDLLPIGFAIHNEERDRTYSESWSYHIIGERLIAYKYGKTSEVQVQNIEKSLNTIIEQFEGMKKDLVFLLSENEDQQT